MLIVCALLAISSGVAIAGWHGIRAALAIRTAAKQVSMDIGLTRLRAINRHTNQRIVFERNSGSYRLQNWQGSTYVDATTRQLPAGTMVTAFTAPNGAIAFRARGSAITFGSITLQNEQGEKRQVVVDIAGAVRVQEGP